MIRKILFVVLLLIVVGVATACNGRRQGMNFENGSPITATQAHEMIQTNPDAIILDVRTQAEFDARRIPNAMLIPSDVLAAQATELLPDKNALILVHCRSGVRSAAAVELLLSMGYTNILDFGGILDWYYETIDETIDHETINE